MKKKNQIVILAPLVLLIWGIIAYRVFKAVKGKTEVRVANVPQLPFKQAAAETTTYELQLDYEDPFLKNRRYYRTPGPNTNSNPTAVKKVKPRVVRKTSAPPVQWPRIVYHGLISHKEDKTTLYLVEVDGDSHFLKVGEAVNELRLVKAFPDSIYVRYKEEKEKKTFVKTL